jgi:hypothetical protein
VYGGHLDCFRYAHKHGAEFDQGESTPALLACSTAFLEYALEHRMLDVGQLRSDIEDSACDWSDKPFADVTGVCVAHGVLTEEDVKSMRAPDPGLL